jgi:hypothetical protein
MTDDAQLRAELEHRDVQRSQWQHREATLNHWLGEVRRERDRLRLIVALVATSDHKPPQDAAP